MKPPFPARHAPLAITALCLLIGGCQVLNAPLDTAAAAPTVAQPAGPTPTMPAPRGPFDETPITPVEPSAPRAATELSVGTLIAPLLPLLEQT